MENNFLDELRTLIDRYGENKDLALFLVAGDGVRILTSQIGQTDRMGSVLLSACENEPRTKAIIVSAAATIVARNKGLRECLLGNMERLEQEGKQKTEKDEE